MMGCLSEAAPSSQIPTPHYRRPRTARWWGVEGSPDFSPHCAEYNKKHGPDPA